MWYSIIYRVNSRFIDSIYQFLIPAGIQSPLYSLIFFLLFLGILGGIKAIDRMNQTSTESTRRYGIIALSVLFFTLFYPGILIMCILVGMWILLMKTYPLRTTHRKYKRLFTGLSVLFGILLIGGGGLSGFLLFHYSKTSGLPFFIGLSVAIVYFCVMSLLKRPIKIQPWFASKKTLQITIYGSLLFMILSGLVYVGGLSPVNPSSLPPYSAETPTQLTIMTYNIKNAGSMEKDSEHLWQNRKSYLATYIDMLSPDVFGVQEAYASQLHYLCAHLKSRAYRYIGVGRDDGAYGGETAAIFFDTAKYEFLDGDCFWLSETPLIPSKQWDPSNYRICTWIHLQDRATSIEFFVFDTHFSTLGTSSGANVRAWSAALIHSYINLLTADYPVILLGDFNMENSSSAYGLLQTGGSKHLYDTLKNYTTGITPFDYSTSGFSLTTNKEFKRIDYIFISAAISCGDSWIPKEGYGNNWTYSDHFPVLAMCTIG